MVGRHVFVQAIRRLRKEGPYLSRLMRIKRRLADSRIKRGLADSDGPIR